MKTKVQDTSLVFVSCSMKLCCRILGHGKPMLILHGLFGSSDNWHTLAKTFSAHFKVFAVDQRNHGKSPHSEEFDYTILTEDIYEFIAEHRIENPIIIGHSMGGKAAMNFALKYPNKVERLIIVDIAPRYYPIHHETILRGLKTIPLEQLESRTHADQILSQYVPNSSIRQFLLKNLVRNHNQKFHWSIHLNALDRNIDNVGAAVQHTGQFDKPSLFIYGTKSDYVTRDDEKQIKILFPKADIVPLDTGHWVHAENPKAFAGAVYQFLKLSP